MYNRTPACLAARIRQDYERMFVQMRTKPRLFRFKSFSSFEEAETDRRAAAQRFLADYEGNVRHGRYVRGALPLLPFLDGAFDLVLCAHLLFIYAARFDFDWHLEACAELARVSSGEVRIHPVCGADGRPYAELARVETRIVGARHRERRRAGELRILRRQPQHARAEPGGSMNAPARFRVNLSAFANTMAEPAE